MNMGVSIALHATQDSMRTHMGHMRTHMGVIIALHATQDSIVLHHTQHMSVSIVLHDKQHPASLYTFSKIPARTHTHTHTHTVLFNNRYTLE